MGRKKVANSSVPSENVVLEDSSNVALSSKSSANACPGLAKEDTRARNSESNISERVRQSLHTTNASSE